MSTRHLFMLVVTIILLAAVTIGLHATPTDSLSAPAITALQSVRQLHLMGDRVASPHHAPDFAIDGGVLYAGTDGYWVGVNTPPEAVISTFAVDPSRNGDSNTPTLYIGSANAMAVYRSDDLGNTWLRIPLSSSAIGGVTALAIDRTQRLVYVGTDTAGLFRLRDVGSSMILSSQLLVDRPIRQIAVDDGGSGIVLTRTEWELLRAEDFGLTWITVDNLGSNPTALALLAAQLPAAPPTLLVGTMDRGLVVSTDNGQSWRLTNQGLDYLPGTRLTIDALVVDPVQPDVLYLSTSHIHGSTSIHSTPRAIAMTTDRAQTWAPIHDSLAATVVDLIPVPGKLGQLYALTSSSRAPIAIGNAPSLVSATVMDGDVAARNNLETTPHSPFNAPSQLAWVVAGLAALALIYAVVVDLRTRRHVATDRPHSSSTQSLHNRSQ